MNYFWITSQSLQGLGGRIALQVTMTRVNRSQAWGGSFASLCGKAKSEALLRWSYGLL